MKKIALIAMTAAAFILGGCAHNTTTPANPGSANHTTSHSAGGKFGKLGKLGNS